MISNLISTMSNFDLTKVLDVSMVSYYPYGRQDTSYVTVPLTRLPGLEETLQTMLVDVLVGDRTMAHYEEACDEAIADALVQAGVLIRSEDDHRLYIARDLKELLADRTAEQVHEASIASVYWSGRY